MFSQFKKNYLCLISCFLVASCDLINPIEPIPAYIQVDGFQLHTTNIQGSNQHQINDVWAFVGSEPLGVFELPATIPVLKEGKQSITLFGGIRANALRSSPIIYPFYERVEQEVSLLPGEVHPLAPTIVYTTTSIFAFMENFEGNLLQLTSDNSNGIQQTKIPSQIKEGIGSGSIQLNDNETVTISSPVLFDLPTSENLPVFLEMDYRTNIELEVGLRGRDINTSELAGPTDFKITLCPITQWNKVYISFQEELQLSQFEGYQLVFRASLNNTGCAAIETNNPEILLDNIKLIRFQP